jgi:hypothetical protein
MLAVAAERADADSGAGITQAIRPRQNKSGSWRRETAGDGEFASGNHAGRASSPVDRIEVDERGTHICGRTNS